MATYKAPLADMRFVLNDLLGEEQIGDLPGADEVTPDLVDAILEEAAKVCEGLLSPLNRSGDEEGCHFENGVVRTP
ncbi:MAG: acyl-CoA dehydrogenase N-terminal domain-containing protein, partial [Proteobacteria bacterium]|nr:acyl-CoA dehydrogenase N-terminal domain-containing protein [Pseudomonadota bacterium]